MELIKRDHCVLTEKKDLEFLYSFSNLPAFIGCTTESEETDIKVDMDWYISKETGCIQINPLIPLEILYKSCHLSLTPGKIWTEHHIKFAEFINKYDPKSVFEIGGGLGILPTEYYKNHLEIPWTIIEANPMPIEGCKAKFIKGFFDENFVFETKPDLIVFSHLLEHIYEPQKFLQNIANVQKQDDLLLFSFPNMEVGFKEKFINCINFEHNMYLPEEHIDYLILTAGYHIIEKSYYLTHSIFYAVEKDTQRVIEKLCPNLYAKNQLLFDEYIYYYTTFITSLNEQVKTSNSRIYIFGAHIFTQFLINFGLNTDKIIKILDNDSNKQGKRLYGTSFLVDSPRCLADEEDPVVILKVGAYANEIKEDILNNINPNVTFIE